MSERGKARNSNALLDIAGDDSFMSNFILPENGPSHDPEELSKNFGQKAYSVVYPAPGACVKTRTDTGEKVFINVCTSEKIPAPRDVSDASEANQSFCISMSIGNERLESDRAGKSCPTYDVVINKSYFEECQKQRSVWLFTILQILEAVSHKYNKALSSEDFVVLKNITVLGKLQPHRIENRQPRKQPRRPAKPLIEEISSGKIADPISEQFSRGEKSSTSNYAVLRYPREGTPTRLIGLFRVPRPPSAKDVTVLLAPDRMIITTEDEQFSYDVFVPFDIDEERASGILYKDEELLRLDLPVKSG